METTREKSVSIGGFSGMVSDADPRDLDRNQLQMAVNICVEKPGELVTRRGLVPTVRYGHSKYSHWTGVKPSHIVIRDVLDNPTFIAWQSNGTNGQLLAGIAESVSPESSTRNEWKALHNSTRGLLSPSYSEPSFALTSAGEVFVANGYNRPVKWGGKIGSTPASTVTSKTGNQFLPAGIDAPTAAPTMTYGYGSTDGPLLAGNYLAAYRYLDYEGNPSNLSPIAVIANTAAGNTLSWSISQPSSALPSYDRIAKIQLLRTGVGVASEFYAVQTLPVGTSTHYEAIMDSQLRQLPATILFNPDGTVNANRFGIPPTKPIVVWHQDRLWFAGYSVYSTGTVSVLNGSAIVTGTGVAFSSIMDGWEITFDVDGAAETYRIQYVSDASNLILERASETLFTNVDYAIRPALSERNTIYYSEADEPEACPVEQNYVILQSDSSGTFDEGVVSLMSYGPTLYAIKPTTMYRLDSVTQPHLDAAVSPAFYRGVFNHSCWVQVDGVAYMMDRLGCYAFTHSQPMPIGDAIANYFRDNAVDFSKSAKFHVSANRRTKTVRFHVALVNKNQASDYPMWAFVYNYRTKAWWIERYPWGVCGAGTFRKSDGSEQYYVFPDGYAPHYETNGASDYLSTPLRLQLTAITNTVADGTDYTARLTITGIDSTYIGCPIAFATGAGKGLYGIITGVHSTNIYTARLFTVVAPLALPEAGDFMYLGGVPYEFKTKQFSIVEAPDGTRREISVWYSRQTTDTASREQDDADVGLLENDGVLLLESGDSLLLESSSDAYSTTTDTNAAVLNVRHFLDGDDIPVPAETNLDSNGDQVQLIEGSPDGIVPLVASRAGTLVTGVARKQFGPSVLLHDVPSPRLVEFEIAGVAAEERVSINHVDIEGAV